MTKLEKKIDKVLLAHLEATEKLIHSLDNSDRFIERLDILSKIGNTLCDLRMNIAVYPPLSSGQDD